MRRPTGPMVAALSFVFLACEVSSTDPPPDPTKKSDSRPAAP